MYHKPVCQSSPSSTKLTLPLTTIDSNKRNANVELKEILKERSARAVPAAAVAAAAKARKRLHQILTPEVIKDPCLVSPVLGAGEIYCHEDGEAFPFVAKEMARLELAVSKRRPGVSCVGDNSYFVCTVAREN